MTSSNSRMSNYEPSRDEVGTTVADGTICTVKAKGNLKLDGLNLKPVLHIPELKCNLLSVSKITKNLN